MGNQYPDTNRVIITEMGAPAAAGEREAGEHDTGQTPGVELRAAGGSSIRRGAVNPYFIAAWLLVAAMMGVGILSLAFSAGQMGGYWPTQSGPGMPEISTYDLVMSTLIYPWGTGSLLLAGGCLLAGVLLAVHGIHRAKARSGVASAVQA